MSRSIGRAIWRRVGVRLNVRFIVKSAASDIYSHKIGTFDLTVSFDPARMVSPIVIEWECEIMVRENSSQDRYVMVGLLVLGLATVSAGFLSGRVVLDQALESYAVQAATDWTRGLESRLGAADGAIAPRASNDQVKSSQTSQSDPGHIKSARGADYALLNLRMAPISRSKTFSEAELDLIRKSEAFGPVFDQAVVERRAKLLNINKLWRGEDVGDYRFYVIVPIVEQARVQRVYVTRLDQSAAFRMTKDALTRSSLVTTLLMVLGFVVPAAVASRRIRERQTAEEQLRYLALHDPLTGLANRNQLQDRLQLALARAKRRGDYMAVFCLDLDRFKDVNDTHGHPAGDALLAEVAARIRGVVRSIDVVARLGGDEFAIVAEEFAAPDHAAALAERLCESLSKPYCIDGQDIHTSASIGIAFGPEDVVEPAILLSQADIALYRAKHNGRNGFCFFEAEMDEALQAERQLQKDLRGALNRGELHLHYQPLFDVRSGNINGYEALARWQHPERGDVAPGVFIPVAEQAGLIAELSEWVLRTACGYAVDWPEHVRLSVNLSPMQFKSQNVPGCVAAILQETGFPAHRLELEVTEGVLLANSEDIVAQIEALDNLGVSLAMDDFGTGYSSLNYLTRLPVTKIKIDRSFMRELGSDSQKNTIVSTIIGLGHSLDLTITAEGVETAEQLEYLKAFGCDEVQGYFCGRPRAEIVQKPFVVVNNTSPKAASS